MIVLVVCAAAELRRVTVLMRHGTKVPDAGIVSLCPSYGTLLDAFRSLSTKPGSLTPSGVAQCHAMGQWARTRYAGHSGLLPEDYDPQSFAFISQRSGFCVESTAAFASGYFEGRAGGRFAKAQGAPIDVPFPEPGTDVLLNCRDGPCKSAFDGSAKQAEEALAAEWDEKFGGNLTSLMSACGTSSRPGMEAVKAISDGLVWALEAGLLGTAALASSPLASPALHRAVDEMAVWLTRRIFVDPVLSIAACGWPDRFFSSLEGAAAATADPAPPLLDFYLNHREVLYGTFDALGLTDFAFPDRGRRGKARRVPTGTAVFFELHVGLDGAAGVVVRAASPPHEPPTSAAVRATAEVGEVSSRELTPRGCEEGAVCPLQTLRDNYDRFLAKYGSLASRCHLDAPAVAAAAKDEPSAAAAAAEPPSAFGRPQMCVWVLAAASAGMLASVAGSRTLSCRRSGRRALREGLLNVKC